MVFCEWNVFTLHRLIVVLILFCWIGPLFRLFLFAWAAALMVAVATPDAQWVFSPGAFRCFCIAWRMPGHTGWLFFVLVHLSSCGGSELIFFPSWLLFFKVCIFFPLAVVFASPHWCYATTTQVDCWFLNFVYAIMQMEHICTTKVCCCFSSFLFAWAVVLAFFPLEPLHWWLPCLMHSELFFSGFRLFHIAWGIPLQLHHTVDCSCLLKPLWQCHASDIFTAQCIHLFLLCIDASKTIAVVSLGGGAHHSDFSMFFLPWLLICLMPPCHTKVDCCHCCFCFCISEAMVSCQHLLHWKANVLCKHCCCC